MKLYIGIVRTGLVVLLMGLLLTVTAAAIPLPTSPPEVDSTPVSHEAEPEGFRDSERIAEPSPTLPPSPEPTLQPVNRSVDEPDRVKPDKLLPRDGLDTPSVLLIGAVIWYAIVMIGVTGGRRGTGRRRRTGART